MEVNDTLTPEQAIRRIFELLYIDTTTTPPTFDTDKEWDAGMLDDIAEIVLGTGMFDTGPLKA